MTIEEVYKNCPEGWEVNQNEKIVQGILKGINRNNGDCPCNNNSKEPHCPCSNFRENGYCCCKLYIKKASE